jgi:pimeloyl-ACP methyl ester carboxylesterase
MKALRFTLTLLALGYLVSAHADPKEFLYLRLQEEVTADLNMNVFKSVSPALTSAGIMEQRIDHNNAQDTRTFAQRYWVNSSYAAGTNSPVVLFICGEGECGDYAVGGQAARHAQQLKAYVVALEHRYYGTSQPFADLSSESLRYLTVDQALQDLRSFRTMINQQLKITGPWLTIGGSYPGALSAYVRALYPQEFAGALASSGPVQADLDFSKYDHHVAKMAGPACLAAVQKVVAELEVAVQNPATFEAAKTEFNASILRDPEDFLYLIADTGAAAVQYGMREQFCSLVQSKGRAGYAQAAGMVAGLFGNLANMSAQAAESSSLEGQTGAIGMRQWFYQSCTEFGYWQNAWPDAAESARSPRINPAYHARLCDRLFGMKTPANVEATNAKYYAPLLQPSTTHILFTNGSEDPWMNLSITDANKNHVNPNVATKVMAGAAHCDDLGWRSSTDIDAAKALFLNLANQWVSEPKKKSKRIIFSL